MLTGELSTISKIFTLSFFGSRLNTIAGQLLRNCPFVSIGVNLRIFLLDKQEEFYWTSLCHSLVPHLFMATFPHDFFSPDFSIFVQFIFRFNPLPDKSFSMIWVFLRLTPIRSTGHLFRPSGVAPLYATFKSTKQHMLSMRCWLLWNCLKNLPVKRFL